MQAIALALVLSGLLGTPVIAYLVLWCVSWVDDDQSGGRPEPPAPNHPKRSIPGRESDR